jgi:hypothetical protein
MKMSRERHLTLCQIAIIGGSNVICTYPMTSISFDQRVDYMRDEIYLDAREIKRSWQKAREKLDL